MKAWIQRTSYASVSVDGKELARIGAGYLILLGVTHTDTVESADKLAERIPNLRLFEDDTGHTNRSIQDIGGEILVISQFTLYADTSHGRRPGFSAAARPEQAHPLYERVVANLRQALGADRVKTGKFGAHMEVKLLNDGPMSLELLA